MITPSIIEYFDEAVKQAKKHQMGLCNGLSGARFRFLKSKIPDTYDMIIQDLMYEWPEFSGSWVYPVPGRYSAHCHSWRMWSRWYPYGRARRRMVTWIREKLVERYGQ